MDNSKDSEKEIFLKYCEECIKSKMCNMQSQECPNPNLIFFQGFSEEEKIEMDIFR